MTLEDVKKIIEAQVIVGSDNMKIEVDVGCASDLMSDVLAFAESGCILITGLTNPQVVRTAEMADIKAICFIRGKKPDEKTIELAKDKNIPLLTTHLAMFEGCGRLYEKGLRGLGYLYIGGKND